ncbi:MAG: hypothetical protein B6I20_05470 [Bacteroidetes bacterium 4572_117]|nr:MAG: hypothetical protein B6I20_05470 [Bacteroidetes bacterium 4572_117]
MVIQTHIDGKIDVEIDADTIIKELNELDLIKRWAYVAKILNNIHLRDAESLAQGQKMVLHDFLQTHLKLYK